MPRVKEEVSPMTRLLKSYDVCGTTLASALRCSYPTAKKKLNDPKHLTLGDLNTIRRVYGIPVAEIRERVI